MANTEQITDDKWDRQRRILKAAEILKDVTLRIVKSISVTGVQIDQRSKLLTATLLRLHGLMVSLEDLAQLDRIEDMGCLLRLMSEWAVDSAYLMLAQDEEVTRFIRYGEVNASRYLRNFENTKGEPNPELPDEFRNHLHADAQRTSKALGYPEKATSWTATDVHSRATFVDLRYSPPDAAPGQPSFAFRLQARAVFASAHIYAHPSYEALTYLLPGMEDDAKHKTLKRREEMLRILAGGAMCMSMLGQFANTTRSLPFEAFFEVANRILLTQDT